MQKIFSFGLVLSVVCALSGCGDSYPSQDLMIGKWQVRQQVGSREISGKTEFRRNGSMTTEAMGMKIESTYRFIDANNIEIEMSVGGRKLTEVNRIASITKEKMVLVDPQGGRALFTRAK